MRQSRDHITSHSIGDPSCAFRRPPPQSSIDSGAHFARREVAIIVVRQSPAYGTVNLTLGAPTHSYTLTDTKFHTRRILQCDIVPRTRGERIADPGNSGVQLKSRKTGRQIEWLRRIFQHYGQHVATSLTCEVSATEDRQSCLFISDDKELDAEAFLQLILPFARDGPNARPHSWTESPSLSFIPYMSWLVLSCVCSDRDDAL